MTIPTRYLIRIVLAGGVAAGLCAAMLFASSGQAARGKTETLRVFEKVESMQLTRSDGRVLKKRPLPEPKAGDVLDIVFADYVGDHAKHAKKPTGSDHLRCRFGAAGPPECVSHAAFGSSMLVVEGNPGRIVLGTGKYLGATGRVVSNKEVKAGPPSSPDHNNIDIVVRINRK
jgi:hypothetical protein